MKTLTKFSRALFAIAMMLCVAFSTLAHDFEVDGIYYNLIEDYDRFNEEDIIAVEVTYNSDDSGTRISYYSGEITIPSQVEYNGETYKVIGIGSQAFYQCPELTNVDFPSSIVYIGFTAFESASLKFDEYNGVLYYKDYCLGYKNKKPTGELVLKDNTRIIAAYAFKSCSELESVTIPESVVGIGYEAFTNCNKLQTVNFNAKECLKMGDGENFVFRGSPSIKEINIGNNVKYLPDFAFAYCDKIETITFPQSIKRVGYNAFLDCTSLSKIIYDAYSAEKFDIYAFHNCESIRELVFGENVNTIADNAFIDFNFLTEVKLPNSITSIGSQAFSGCSNLTKVDLPSSLTTINNFAFSGTKLANINLPGELQIIGSDAFYGCEFTEITIPENVTNIGEYAFGRCNNLTTIYYNAKNCVVDSYAFCISGTIKNKSIQKVYIGETVTQIPTSVFINCDNVSYVSIGSNVKQMNAGIVNQNGVTLMEYKARNCVLSGDYNCLQTKYLVLDSGVETLPDYAFGPQKTSSKSVINTIVSQAFTPPTCSSTTFQTTTQNNATLYVPKGCYATYWSSPVWQDFKNIKEIAYIAETVSLPTSINLALNSSTQLTATITPTNTTITTLFWESSNPNVAIVDQKGNVTAVAKGKATITAYTIDGSGLSASCEVKIGIKEVESIIINQTSAELKPNEMLNLSCSIHPEDATNRTYTWTSSNTAVAVVRTNSDGNATVLGVSPGLATITATTNDGSNLTASCDVKVLKLAESISLDKTSETINTGNTLTLIATIAPEDADYKLASWTISDETLATIKDNGDGTATITAINPGIVTATATTTDGTNLVASCEITITQLATSIALNKVSAELLTNETITLVATVSPDNTSNKTVVWSISDETLATIEDNGDGTATITAINPGVVTVTAMTTDGTNLAVSCEITISQLATSIALDKETAELNTMETLTLTATVLPNNASNKTIAWSVNDETLATINDNGDGTVIVTAVNPGVVTVTAMTTDGTNLAVSCEITITQLATSIVLDKETISIIEGKSEILTATVMPDNTTNKTVEWRSSDESVASVVDNNDGTATITIHKKGIATITVTTTDGSNLSATCEVSGLSGVFGVGVDDIEEKRYDIHGRQLSKPSPCLNIIIKSDGTTSKEIVKE